jgi:hypothetical protein
MMIQGHKLTFLIKILPKNQNQNLFPYILRDWTTKMPSNERWLRWTVLFGKEGGVYIPETSLTIAFSNRPQAVVIIQPPVQMLHLHWRLSHLHWRLDYDNSLWKWIFTGGYKVVVHLFLYTADPKVKPPVKKDCRLRALFYWWRLGGIYYQTWHQLDVI